MAQGEYSKVRTRIAGHISDAPTNKRYLLDRVRLGVITLADGYPRSAQLIFQQAYDALRRRGINRDRTLGAIAINEDTKIWKGEPFEQALTMTYYAMALGSLRSWDNARAALQNALFFLRDLDRYASSKAKAPKDKALSDHGFVTSSSKFALGYLLCAIANQQLARSEEASDYYDRVLEIRPALGPLVKTLRRGKYNMVLVVSWGLAPKKSGAGPDGARLKWIPWFPSDVARLKVSVNHLPSRYFPQVLDVNRMSRHYSWDNFKEIRRVKSLLGTGLLYGGVATAASGWSNDSDKVFWAGTAAAATGLLLKMGAHVDERYVDLFPQRVYVVPLQLTQKTSTITLKIEGKPVTRLILPAVPPPPKGQAVLRCLRLIGAPFRSRRRSNSPPVWAVSGKVFYSNPYTQNPEKIKLPYILGGQDVSKPTEKTLADYQQAGNLNHFTLAQLRGLYRAEKITWTIEDQNGYDGRHILEGGKSLVAPVPASVGFVRLYAQHHLPYHRQSTGTQ